MAKFKYIAKNKKGKVLKGELEMADKKEVADSLREDGYWPTSIEEIKKGKKNKGSFFDRITSVSLKSKTIFCRHLAVMINSGLSLSRALDILSAQERNKSFSKVIGKMAQDVKRGITFSEAISKYPNIFDAVFSSMVKMGEVSGNLEEVLKILADQLEKDQHLVSKVRGAMIYPAIVVAAMIIIGVLMMIFVVPQITGIFEEFQAELPITTKIVIGISDFMASNALITIGVMILVVVGFKIFIKTKLGMKIFHMFLLKAPIVGTIIEKVNSARFSRILSSLLNSGISLVESLKITSDTLGNYYFKKASLEASKEIQKGVTLPEVLEKYDNVFPYLIIQMAEVGEETGKTPEVLKKLAEFYEEEVDQITQNMSSIIEPILMLIIGAAVGLFAVAIIQPIYSIMSKI